MSDLALKTARGLEKARVKVSGASAAIELLDRTGQVLATVQHSFFVERKTSLVLSDTWLEAEIAERSSVTGQVQATQAQMLKVVSVKFAGVQFTASLGEDPMTAERTCKLRLSPFMRTHGGRLRPTSKYAQS